MGEHTPGLLRQTATSMGVVVGRSTYEENPCWEGLPDFGEVVPDDYDDENLTPEGMCDYCGAGPWRFPDGEPHVDPFGQKMCCRPCFDQIVGGDE